MGQGKVFLVGAGPGDPDLITLKGKKLLEKADVVIYDYLANPKLLSYCRENAEKIYVGKKGGSHTLSQQEINRLIVQKAKEGKLVVRLKGGDPFLFGRGGEELEALVEENIPFEVVPGITSAIAVPAYAGIPVTHREYTSTFAVVTGHEAEGKEKTSIEFSSLTKIGSLVFLMGVKNLPYIIENLKKEGKPLNTPVAVIQWGTLPKQKTVTGTLEDIVEKVNKAGLSSPAVIIIGKIVKLREKFNWFENKPLFGKKILVTRTRNQAGKLSELLEDLGAEVIEIPLIRIVPLITEEVISVLEKIENYDWIVFTSENGVNIFMETLFKLGKDVRVLGKAKIAVIGKATKEVLAKWRLKADLVPTDNFTQEGLVEAFSKVDIKGKEILVPRAKEAREFLAEQLKRMGGKVKILPIYETLFPEDSEVKLKKILASGVDVITFTSSSTVKNFFKVVKSLDKKFLDNLVFASIGPITSQELRNHGFNPTIEAKISTIEGLVEAIKNFFERY